MRRRILSGMLALCLLLCLTPATVLAEESSEPANYSQVSNDGEDNPGIVVNANGGDEEILSDEENSVQPGAPAGEDGDTGAGDENVPQDPAQSDEQDGNDAGEQPASPDKETGEETGSGEAGDETNSETGGDVETGDGEETDAPDEEKTPGETGSDAETDTTPGGTGSNTGSTGTEPPANGDDPQKSSPSNTLSVQEFSENLATPYAYTGHTEFDVGTEEELAAALNAANQAATQATAAGETSPLITIRLKNDITLNNGTKTGAYYTLTGGANVSLTSTEDGPFTLKFDNSQANSRGVYFFQVEAGSSLTLSNITLDCNSANSSKFQSTAVYLKESNLVINDGTKITNSYCRTSTCMAVIYAALNCTVTMNGGEISDNDGSSYSGSSSGVVAVVNSSFIMNGGKIENNITTAAYSITRTGRGGIVAICASVNGEASFTMNGGSISNNKLLKNSDPGYGIGVGGAIAGAALRGAKTTLTINDGIIANNSAGGGGAIAVSVNRNSSCELILNDGAVIRGNKAVGPAGGEGGGAIAAYEGAKVIMNGGLIEDNYSDTSGGAIQLFDSCTMEMYGGTIQNNTAESHAGAICVAAAFSDPEDDDGKDHSSSLYLYGGSIESNTAKSNWSVGDHDDDPFAPGGGGVFLHGNCNLYLYGPSDKGSGASITGNKTESAGCGGGVYTSFGGTVVMDGGLIENNTAAHSGGGVYLDGVGSYEGITHSYDADDSYGTGALLLLHDGRIANNTAQKNGGGLYLSGENTLSAEDAGTTESLVYRGAVAVMDGGVITANNAWNAGGGVYVESTTDQGEQAATFTMTGGALYFNVAGDETAGNTSPEAEDAGAELYAQGGKSQFTVPAAEAITAYIQDSTHTYVPEEDRAVWFTSWYDDYSDQDPQYGKGDSQTLQTARHTGRYMSSKTLDRMAYLPVSTDKAYRALILDRSTSLQLSKLVSGENIRPGETYAFTLTVSNLPDLAVAGDRYPVELHSSTENPAIGTLTSGQKYLTFAPGNTATVYLQAGDSLLVDGLPAGAQFSITETNAGSAARFAATVTNGENPQYNTGTRTVTGATTAQWKGSTQYTRTEVQVDNGYVKPVPGTPAPPTPAPSAEPVAVATATIPQTGDASQPALWWAVLVISGMGLAALFLRKKTH